MLYVCFVHKQPIAQFRGQATDIDIARKEVRNVKDELVNVAPLTCFHLLCFAQFSWILVSNLKILQIYLRWKTCVWTWRYSTDEVIAHAQCCFQLKFQKTDIIFRNHGINEDPFQNLKLLFSSHLEWAAGPCTFKLVESREEPAMIVHFFSDEVKENSLMK